MTDSYKIDRLADKVNVCRFWANTIQFFKLAKSATIFHLFFIVFPQRNALRTDVAVCLANTVANVLPATRPPSVCVR